jgi:Xaa-Pro aminopeptidase
MLQAPEHRVRKVHRRDDIREGAHHMIASTVGNVTADPEVYARRLAAVREAAATHGIHTLVLADPANVMHLTGYWTILSTMMPEALVITPRRATLLAPALERAAVDALGLPWIDLLGFRTYPLQVGPGVDPARPFGDALKEALTGTASPIGLELSDTRHQTAQAVETIAAGRVIDVGPILRGLRAEKDVMALTRIRQAGHVVAASAVAARSRTVPGAHEADLAAAIAECIWSSGARATHIVVGSGPRGIILHAEPTGRLLREGDLVVIDIGVLVDGYWAEIARTMSVGTPSREQVTWHDAVLAAQAAAAGALAPGVTGHEIDAAARQVLTDRGFDGASFNHSAGHGLGLLGMDLPAIAPNSTDRVPSAGAVTIEPGLYFPNRGGVRIEDTYLLDDGKVEELTGWVSKDLAGGTPP